MKRDVKVGLLVAAVVCGVAAILLGGGLVGEEPPPAPILAIADDPAAASTEALPAEVTESIVPPVEDEIILDAGVEEPADADLVAMATAPAGGDELAEAEAEADAFLRLDFSNDLVLPDVAAPQQTPPIADVPASESPDVWEGSAPSVGDADPAVPVDVPAVAEVAQEPAVPEITAPPAPPAVDVAPPATGVSTPVPLVTDHYYEVQNGDSFFTISKKLFGTVRYFPDLQKANPDIDPRRLRAGMKIAVPTIAGASPRKELLKSAEEATRREPRVFLAQDKIHVVQPGEILESISFKYYGRRQKWRHIVRANPGLDPKSLRPGMRIVVPALTE